MGSAYSEHQLKGLGRRIRALREQRGLTQLELARKAGVSRPYIARLESDSSQPSLTVLGKVATALDMKTEELLAVTEAPDAIVQVTQWLQEVRAHQQAIEDRLSRIQATLERGSGPEPHKPLGPVIVQAVIDQLWQHGVKVWVDPNNVSPALMSTLIEELRQVQSLGNVQQDPPMPQMAAG
jgi:transcriptional regulator with XRE-family HTH domain